MSDIDVDPVQSLLAADLEIIDLGVDFFTGMPQSSAHPAFQHALQRRHGDLARPDGSTGASDIIVTGGHVGTHIDALSHAAYLGEMYGGVDAIAASVGGRFTELGAETIPPMVCRGVFLDVPKALGVDRCEAGYEITAADLRAAQKLAGVEIRQGDVILVRTGWGSLFPDRVAYEGDSTGVPGPGVEGAEWLAGWKPLCVGGDTISFERVGPRREPRVLAAHRILLVELGIYIVETMALEALSARGVNEFLFVLSPLKILGATGSPVRPLAVISTTETAAGR
jgi:kynurenine formamidase